MKLRRVLGLVVAAQLFWIAAAFGQATYKAEVIGAASSTEIPKPVQESLAAQGTRVVDAQGTTLLEVWMPKTVATSATPSSGLGVTYGTLTEGTFLGVIHYPKPSSDFRGQAIKAGFYTLRYSLIPQDGNHMGVFGTRDAIHLGPVSADTDVNKTLSYNDLIKLGRMVSGTPHPAFLVMEPATGDDFPAVTKDDMGYWDLEVKAHGQSGELPLAITVVGQWQG